MASGAIITAWLLWSLRLEPFVATLDPGKGAELTFPRREQGEEWLKPPTVLRAQISHQRPNCTLLLFWGLSLSLVSSFYVYAPACCVVPETSYPIQCDALEWPAPKEASPFVDSC